MDKKIRNRIIFTLATALILIIPIVVTSTITIKQSTIEYNSHIKEGYDINHNHYHKEEYYGGYWFDYLVEPGTNFKENFIGVWDFTATWNVLLANNVYRIEQNDTGAVWNGTEYDEGGAMNMTTHDDLYDWAYVVTGDQLGAVYPFNNSLSHVTWHMHWRYPINSSISSCICLIASNGAYVGIDINTSTDDHMYLIINDSSTHTSVDLGVSDTDWHEGYIQINETAVVYSIDENTYATVTTTIPSANTKFAWKAYIQTLSDDLRQSLELAFLNICMGHSH